jgi:phenylalanyl-tRNA synthetase beta chain
LSGSIDNFKDFEEKKNLLFILTGKKVKREWYSDEKEFDIFDLKGLIFSFFDKFSLDNVLNDSYNSIQNKIYDYYFTINFKETVLGSGGRLKNNVLKMFDIEQPVYSFEVDVTAFNNLITANKSFNELLKYPKVVRDVAFIFNKSVKYAEVKEFIINESSNILKSVELFDLFQSKEIGEGKKSMAFSMEYYDYNRTLTDEEVDTDFQTLIGKITKNFNATLRGK